MFAVYAANSRVLAQFAYQFIKQEHISHFLVSSIFAQAIWWRAADNQPQKPHIFSPVLNSPLPGQLITAIAFLTISLSVPVKLKTAAIGIPFLKKIAETPALHMPHVLAATTALIAVIQTIKPKAKIKKLAHGLSSIAFGIITYVAFKNIGSWKQTVAAAAIFATVTFISKPIIGVAKAIFTRDLTDKTHGYITMSLSGCIVAILGRTVKSLSWLPKSEVRLVTTGIGLASFLYSCAHMKASPTA